MDLNRFGYVVLAVVSVSAVASAAGIIISLLLRKKVAKSTLMGNSVKVPLRLVDRVFITHDTMLMKFALPTQEHVLGLPIGNHVQFKAKINNELVIRSYTPVSMANQNGYADFIIKVYKANVHPKFPDGGKMSQYLSTLPVDKTIDVSGPTGKLEYKGSGIFHIKSDATKPPNVINAKRINMICGGSGITPMYQLIQHILNSKSEKDSRISLIFANQTQNDIILYNELNDLCSKHGSRLRVWYTLDNASDHWEYGRGHINADMLMNNLFPPGDDTIVLCCGPAPMIEFACLPNLEKLSYRRDLIHVF